MAAFEVSSVLRVDFGCECLRVALSSDPNGFLAYDRELFGILAVLALAAIAHHHGRKTFAVSASQRTEVKDASFRSGEEFLDGLVKYKPKRNINVLTILDTGTFCSCTRSEEALSRRCVYMTLLRLYNSVEKMSFPRPSLSSQVTPQALTQTYSVYVFASRNPGYCAEQQVEVVDVLLR